MRNAPLLVLTLFVTSIIASPACSAETKPQEVVIGALLSLTGGLSSSGESCQAALEIALDDINEYLTEIDSPMRIELLIEDTGTNPATALEKLMSLEAAGAQIVIGPLSSAETAFVKDYADEKGILLISPESTAPSLAIPGDNVFRFALGDALQAEAMADLMWRDGIRAVVPLQRGDVWGDDFAAAISNRFEERGGVILEGIRYNPTDSDFTPEIATMSSKVNQAITGYGNESVGVLLLSFDEAEDIFVLAQNDLALSSVRWYGSDGFALSQALVSNPEAAQFAMSVGLVCPVYGGDLDLKVRIEQRVWEKIGRQPDAFSLAAYDTAWVAALTHLTTWASEDPAILKTAFNRTANFYLGATGVTSLDDAGDRQYGEFLFWVVVEHNGDFQWKSVARWIVLPGWQGWVEYDEVTDFPSRPITIISGWLGGSEQFLHAIVQEVENVLNVPVTVVNHIGNDGMDAVHAFETAPADGYTLLLILDFDAARYAQGIMGENPAEDWVPIFIGNMAITQIYVRSDDPRYSTWDELVTYAQKNPELKLANIADTFSLEGLSTMNLEKAFDVSFESVPFDSAPQRNASFLNGETDLLIDQPGDVKQYLDAGRYKPILTLWNERVTGFEDVPTAKEKGADFDPLVRLRGLAAPGGTSPQVIEILKTVFQSAFNSTAYQHYLMENSLDLTPYPDDPVTAIREQVELYKQLYDSMEDPNSRVLEWGIYQ